jgi:integrase
VTARRKQLPISQRHRPDHQARDCDCPWSFRVRLPDSTMPRVTRDTYAEAEQAYHELMARRPEPLADRTTTIAQWADRWLAVARGVDGAEWRPGTLRNRRYAVAKRIVPEFGHYLMTELRRDDVRLWVTRMRQQGTGTSAMFNATEVLHSMYSAWLKDDRILPRGNPVDLRLIEKQPRKEFAPLTARQVEALAGAMPADMALMVRIEAFYGARMSEITGLRDEDVIFTGRLPAAPLAPQLAKLAALPADRYETRRLRLRFQRKLERDRTEGPIKNERGNRTLPLPQWLAAALAAQLGKWPPVDGWLFTNPRAPGYGGKAVAAHPRPFTDINYQRRLKNAARAAGIVFPPRQCTHALRHHCVSVLRDKGWSDQAIGYWIGDTSQTVAEVYGRPMPDALDRISAELSAAREATGPVLRAVE